MSNTYRFLGFVLILTIVSALPVFSDKPVSNGGWDPSWSPDGSRIAFTSGTPHSIPNLWVMNVDGSGVRRLTTRGANGPSWLPDGKSIVFGTIRSGDAAFMSIDALGQPGTEKPVEGLPSNAEAPLWSPDGSQIAYGVTSADGRTRDVWLKRTNGGDPVNLATRFWVREWAWSTDGRTLALVVGRSIGTSLWLIDTGNRDIQLLYRGFCGAPSYSPDGKRLAIAVPDKRSAFKIIVIDPATRKEKWIGVRTFDGEKLTWSPDGSRLFFASARKAEPAIWTVGIDGKDLHQLTPKGLPARQYSLSPDGMKFAFQAMKDDSYSPEIYTCDVSGGSITKLTQSSPSFWSPVWSPDGRKLAYESDVKHTHEVFTASPTGGKRKSVVKVLTQEPVDVVWFPDGKKLLLSDVGTIGIVDITTAKITTKLYSPDSGQGVSPCLSGDRVYFSEFRSMDQASICSIGLDGKGKKILTNKPVEKPAAEPEKDKEAETRTSESLPKGVLVASTQFYVAQDPGPKTEAGAGDKPKDSSKDKTDPHAGLGLMGPHVYTDKPKEMEKPVVDLSPAVSPDGKTVAFLRDSQLWVVDSEGTIEKQLTKFPVSNDVKRLTGSPSWSPGGDFIVFPSFSKQGRKIELEIWLSGSEPGSERRIYSEEVDSEYSAYYQDCTNPPVFTPDRKQIIFTSISGDEPRIMSVGLDGSSIRELVTAPSAFPSIDRTGKKLAYVDLSTSRENIRILDLTSGKHTKPLFR